MRPFSFRQNQHESHFAAVSVRLGAKSFLGIIPPLSLVAASHLECINGTIWARSRYSSRIDILARLGGDEKRRSAGAILVSHSVFGTPSRLGRASRSHHGCSHYERYTSIDCGRGFADAGLFVLVLMPKRLWCGGAKQSANRNLAACLATYGAVQPHLPPPTKQNLTLLSARGVGYGVVRLCGVQQEVDSRLATKLPCA